MSPTSQQGSKLPKEGFGFRVYGLGLRVYGLR